MELVKEAAFYLCFFFFILGLLCTVTTGSIKAFKVCISIVSLVLFIATVVALVFSQGLVIFVLPQLITLAIIFIIFISMGAALGYFIFIKLIKNSGRHKINKLELDDYVTLSNFSTTQGLDEGKVLKRVQSGYYRGGKLGACWYVHKSELS